MKISYHKYCRTVVSCSSCTLQLCAPEPGKYWRLPDKNVQFKKNIQNLRYSIVILLFLCVFYMSIFRSIKEYAIRMNYLRRRIIRTKEIVPPPPHPRTICCPNPQPIISLLYNMHNTLDLIKGLLYIHTSYINNTLKYIHT